MFCHKCGTEIAEGAEFCHKCGAKAAPVDEVQQPAEAATPVQAVVAEPTTAAAAQQAPSAPAPEKKDGLRTVGRIGQVLLDVSMVLLLIRSFLRLPINPVILVVGVFAGIIMSIVGAKRPWGLSTILQLVLVVVVLVISVVIFLSYGESNDQYVQMVKEGTLNGYPQKTVGEAFDGFLKNPKWESGLSDNDERFVNVTGKILYYDKEVNLAVQFIVDEKSGSFEYNTCEINDVPQNNLTFWGLLEAVYDDDSAAGEDSSSASLAP